MLGSYLKPLLALINTGVPESLCDGLNTGEPESLCDGLISAVNPFPAEGGWTFLGKGLYIGLTFPF